MGPGAPPTPPAPSLPGEARREPGQRCDGQRQQSVHPHLGGMRFERGLPTGALRAAALHLATICRYGTGMTGGAPLSFTKNTTNFAGRESLAFFDTACTSLGDS